MKIPRTPQGDYIQGQFRQVDDPNGEINSHDPGDLDQAKVAFPFSFEHVHEAVTSAKRAFQSWKRIPATERIGHVTKYGDLIKQRSEELARAITFEIGKPLWESRAEVQETIDLIKYYAKRGSQTTVEMKIEEADADSAGFVRFMPRGTMAVITPATVPVFASFMHLIPALMDGNTVVLKASKRAPYVGQCLAEICHDSGFPSGVLNVIQGDEELGRRLVGHPEIDGILFTGSFETGTKIRKAVTSDYWKVLVLDTGGKNAMLVWDDADYQRSLKDALMGSLLTSGQRCTSSSRILVHKKLFDRFVTDFHALAKRCRVDHGATEGDDAPFLGALVSEEAMENYLRFQGIAVREGGEEIMRGKPLEREKKGFYVSPSIHRIDNPDAKSVYQTTEIFGPDVALYCVEDLQQAAEIINLTRHGLCASIYTGARENYLRLADDARVGLLHWNRPTTALAYMLPYGGIKQSGNARPMGSFAGYQCTYPLSSLESEKQKSASAYPTTIPKLGGE